MPSPFEVTPGRELENLAAQNRVLVDRAQVLNVKNRDLELEVIRIHDHVKVLEFLLGACVLAIPILVFICILLYTRHR